MLADALASAMQRIVSSDETRFAQSKKLLQLVEYYNLGSVKGNSVHFTEKHKEEMRGWLTDRGYSLVPVDLKELERSEVLAHTPHEKAGGRAVKHNRISVKALPGKALRLFNEDLHLHEGTHLDVFWPEIKQVRHDAILLVENYENFIGMHNTFFDFGGAYASPLIVYRGDKEESRVDYVLSFLAAQQLPVLAFMDADPAGVLMASRLPYLVGMVTPSIERLTEQLSSAKTRRNDLWLQQYPQAASALDALTEGHPCHRLWQLLKQYQGGIVQERWLNRERCGLG